jgi:hypothetical protein
MHVITSQELERIWKDSSLPHHGTIAGCVQTLTESTKVYVKVGDFPNQKLEEYESEMLIITSRNSEHILVVLLSVRQ